VALKSGRMPVEKIIEKGLPFSLATDVGAGPKTSMFDVMRCFIEVHKDIPVATPQAALYYATLAGAEILGFAEETGNLEKGKYADFLVLNAKVEGEEKVPDIIEKLSNSEDYDTIVQKTIFKGKEIYSG
jgi:guanine deaminase